MEHQSFTIQYKETPIIVTTIHNGHDITDEMQPYMNLNDAERLREEDPFTAEIAKMDCTTINVHRSRFETDLNRKLEDAIYTKPEKAWGLKVFNQPLPEILLNKAHHYYKSFYNELKTVIEKTLEAHSYCVVYDVHSYNHKREGMEQPAPQQENPTVNIGTGNTNQTQWRSLIDTFITTLLAAEVAGEKLDVRENIKFKGGYMGKWINENFKEKVCTLSIEFKKIFMDEWTGEPNQEIIEELNKGLITTTAPVMLILQEK